MAPLRHAMKPLAFAASSTLLILATAMNAFLVYGLSRERDFLGFTAALYFGTIAAHVALIALVVINFGSGRKPLSTHPLLCGVGMLNIVFPVARLVLL